MRRSIELQCPHSCAEGRFEALNAPLIVDRHGEYLSHSTRAVTYVCAICQSVAVNIAAAAREMRRAGLTQAPSLACPSCGSRMLPPEDDPLADLVECPFCDHRFSIEEGMTHLHGEPGGDGDESGE